MGDIMNGKSYKLMDDIYWVGAIDYELKVFDIIMETEFGSTYNSYLIVGNNKIALIDTVKEQFKDEFFSRINEIVNIEDIDYLILNHTEPDHSGTAKYIIEQNPNIQVYASAPGLMNLKEIINMPFNANRVKTGMNLSLGNKTLEFYLQPHLHWPDTMFTYLKEDNFLFTCDFFGAHYASPRIVSNNIENQEEYMKAIKDYFDSIMHPFLPYVREGLKTVKQINPDIIGVSHGVVIDNGIKDEIIKLYDDISTLPEQPDKPLILIPYATAYGYTGKMATIIKKTIEEELNNQVTVELFDLIDVNVKDIQKKVPICSALLVGSSTIVRDTVKTVWDLLAGIDYEMAKGKIASSFGSYGWSGEAVDNILQREQQLMFKTVEGLKIKFNPSKEQVEEIKDWARNIVQKLKK